MKTLDFADFEKMLEGVQKPGRYIGKEFGVKSKNMSDTMDLNTKVLFALAFP